MLPVSFGQWDRLKERIGRLGKERVEYVNWVTGAWGICVPCAISFIVYVSQTPRSQWAVALYGAATIAFAIIALILHRFQIQEREIRTEDASDIVREMTTTEEAWLRGETQQ
jgi:predicted membrane channel-forming protein YqfA (hemolysin III family)